MAMVIYRKADRSDILSMARIRALHSGTEEDWQPRLGRYMACEHHPQQALMPRVVYVSVESGSVVGLVAGHLTRRYGCDGELQWIDVIPKCRGTGIAFKLLSRLAQWFAEQEASRICVNVDPANTHARRFYMRHGAEGLNEHWLVWNDIKTVLRQKFADG
jgi:GNAT superfamily N-acetyltransferase